jgi:DNA processing protein
MRDGSKELRDRLWLHLAAGVGTRTFALLIEHFGDAAAALGAPPAALAEVPGIGPTRSGMLRQAIDSVDVDGELALAERLGVSILTQEDPCYPPALRPLPDAPPVLYVLGRLVRTDAVALAVVGSRRCSHYGREQAERLAGGLARAGFTVVSGMARGIDAAAHRGALAVGGRTLAVLGSGLANLYPPEHEELAAQIAAGGAVLSEFPLRTEPKGGHFPVRNRLISGLSMGVLVVEAAARSGALITARLAVEQGKDCFAVPGRVDSFHSAGCNRLIRDGHAKLVTCAADVLAEYPQITEVLEPAAEPGGDADDDAPAALSGHEREVLKLLRVEPHSADEVCDQTGLPVHLVHSAVTMLELKGLVRREGPVLRAVRRR